MFHQFRRERHAAQERAEAAMVLCTEQGFAYYLAWATIIQGWTLAEQEQAEEGIARMHQGLTALRVTGGMLRLPYYLALLAEVYGKAGQTEVGLALLREALAVVPATAEHWWEAELYRLQGELLLQASTRQTWPEAEENFHQALSVARHQQAKSLELRAAMSLGRLWQQQGKCDATRELLAPLYGWFSEGFETADLQEAKALLDAL
jgi:predicted ATPase